LSNKTSKKSQPATYSDANIETARYQRIFRMIKISMLPQIIGRKTAPPPQMVSSIFS